MKKLEAIIRPGTLGAVKDALATMGLEEMTVSEVKCRGLGEGRTEFYRGAEYVPDLARMKIDVVLDDRLAERAARIVALSAGIGHRADALIALLPVDEVIGSWESQHDRELCGHRAFERRHCCGPKRSIPRERGCADLQD